MFLGNARNALRRHFDSINDQYLLSVIRCFILIETAPGAVSPHRIVLWL